MKTLESFLDGPKLLQWVPVAGFLKIDHDEKIGKSTIFEGPWIKREIAFNYQLLTSLALIIGAEASTIYYCSKLAEYLQK